MNSFKVLGITSCLALFGAACVPTVQADQWNKKTILTVNEPLQLPNKVLAPGKYVMKLLDSPSNRHIVQVFNEDETQLQTTILAIPNYRLQPTGKTTFQFWETPAGQPKAMRAWFYPGDNFGQEFAYPKTMSLQIATYAKASVPTTYAESEADLTTARVSTIDEKGTETAIDETASQKSTVAETAPTPAPTAVEQTADRQVTSVQADQATTPMPRSTPERHLPKTASPYPVVGLVGLLSLVGFGVTRAMQKRTS